MRYSLQSTKKQTKILGPTKKPKIFNINHYRYTSAMTTHPTHKQHIEEQEKLFAEENFAALLEEYEKTGQKLAEGTVVKGVIVGISDRGVAVDIGAKSVGFIDGQEFKRDGEINEGEVRK